MNKPHKSAKPGWNILLVEDNPGDALFIEELLSEIEVCRITIANAQSLSDASRQLREASISVVLLDLTLQDSQGLHSLEALRTEAPQIPFIVLTGLDDDNLGVDALRHGAQDYLVKGEINSNLLLKAITYAIERHRLRTQMQGLQDKILEMERHKVVVEVAGAAAHEINHPLTVLLGLTEHLLKNASPEEIETHLNAIKDAAQDIHKIVEKMKSANKYAVKPYLRDVNIVDFDSASSSP